MSEDPISKVYCVGNSKAIIRARWNNLYTFELEYPRFIHSEPDILKDLTLAKQLIDSGHMTPFEHQCRYSFDAGFQYNLRDFQSARYMLDHGIDLSAP